MNEQDIDILLAQIKTIIMNKPLADEQKTTSMELLDLQEAISYLADCLSESNEFLKNLSRGNLEVAAPSRHNFLAGNLKELQSGLRHLTWQASQVANGDYKQRVSFLGDFSDSFNQMIAQLEERENELKNQTDALRKSMNLMIAIMDGLSNWVIVIEKATGDILYSNYSSSEHFYNPQTNQLVCGGTCCEFLERLRNFTSANSECQFEYSCAINGKTLSTKTFSVQWNEKLACVHFISDITDAEVEKRQLESLAFLDELTGIYNRRHGLQILSQLVVERKDFSICMVDLDDLKYVNDKLGHLVGDEFIITVISALQQLESSTSTLWRMGGDEFIIILPNCNEASARQLMVQLDEKLVHIKKGYTVAVSWGVSYVSSDMNLLPESILKRVDDQMYLAKQEKRQAQIRPSKP